MMQNGRAVNKEVRGTAPRTQPVLQQVVHRLDVCSVLECHAIYRVALSPERDLRLARSLLVALGHALAAPNCADFDQLDVQFHAALTAQADNAPMLSLIGAMRAEIAGLCRHSGRSPKPSLKTLWSFQCQHRALLQALEKGQAESAMRCARAHLEFERAQFVSALGRGGAPQRGVDVAPPSTTSVVPVT
jgi:DNA-binding GntR family transcriptional regulator